MVLQIFATPPDADDSTDRDQVYKACAIDHILNHSRKLAFAETYLPARTQGYIGRIKAVQSQHVDLRGRIRRHQAKFDAQKIAKADVILCQFIKFITEEVEWNKALLKIRGMPVGDIVKKLREYVERATYAKMLYFYGEIARYVNFGYIFLAPTPNDAEARRLQLVWRVFFVRELTEFLWDVYYVKYRVNHDNYLIGTVHENINKRYREQLAHKQHQTKPGGGTPNELPMFKVKNNGLKFPHVPKPTSKSPTAMDDVDEGDIAEA